MKKIELIDVTIRDGNQCLWATRMTTAEALPAVEAIDDAGFLQMDVHSALHVDVCVRYLKENPWDRVRLMKQRVKRTPLRMGFRSGNITGFSTRLPDDFVDSWVKHWRAAGIDAFWCHDGLIDVDNIGRNVAIVKKHGGYGVAPLTFTDSPVHTDAVYALKVRHVIERYQADAIMIKDAAGLLTVDRARTLVPAILEAAGTVPVEMHCHCITGLGPLVCLEAVRLGVDRVHTAIPPLSDGASHPSVTTMVRNLRTLDYRVDIDERCLEPVSEYLHAIAKRTGRPIGTPAHYDAFHYKHQIPGGMFNNFRAQLEQADMLHRLDAVLEEVARVRVELGWAVMVTPFSQLVGVQALLNVTTGERYGTVPDEVKRYALGHYGAPPGPIDQDVLDRIVENGSKAVPLVGEPPAPVMPGLRAKYPRMDDEERMLRYLFDSRQVDELLEAGPIRTDGLSLSSRRPLVHLLEELKRRPAVARIHLSRGDDRVELVR